MDDSKRRLIRHGFFLFLLGLLSGFLEQKFVNPRMGLAAHLEGVMLGTFVIALGAALGSAALSPITGAGYSAPPWQNTLVTALFMSVGIATLASTLLVLWG